MPAPSDIAPTDIETQLHCPMCDYDLRGQVDPRCPECGYHFDWEELRDPSRRRHPYLFEHHPQRNIYSFLATLKNGLRPRKFWSTLYPTQRSSPRRLLIYLLLTCITALPAVTMVIAYDVYLAHQQTLAMRASYLRILQGPRGGQYMARYPGLTPQQAVIKNFPLPTLASVLRSAHPREIGALALYAALPVGWLLLTAAAFMVFQWSMRAARVKSIHAWRCIVYSGDVIIWVNVAFIALMMVGIFFDMMHNGVRGLADAVLGLLLPILVLVAFIAFIYRLIIAARRYLRFDHAIATVLATQIIVFLTALVILFQFLQ